VNKRKRVEFTTQFAQQFSTQFATQFAAQFATLFATQFTTQSTHTSQCSNIGHENKLSDVDRTGLWNFTEDSLSFWGGGRGEQCLYSCSSLAVLWWRMLMIEHIWTVCPNMVVYLVPKPLQGNPIKQCEASIHLHRREQFYCVCWDVKSLNAFPLFMQTDSRNLVNTECVTGVWKALRAEEVNYLYSSSYTWYYCFLCGVTAP
jgi:hypothetical protein